MFELGLRLAFDKPTVIIKDDKTEYSFDTSIIEHVGYPRDLRFSKIVVFKQLLAEKVSASYQKAKTDPNHSTFLKSFGTFNVASIQESIVPADKLMLEMLSEMQSEIRGLRKGDIRDRGNKTSSVFAINITHEVVKAIEEFKRNSMPKKSYTDLIDDPKVVDYIEQQIDADKLAYRFNSRTELIDFVDSFVRLKA